MSEVVAVLKDLTRSKRLQPAEQIILQRLFQFEDLLPRDLNDAPFAEIESLLLKLLLVNNGELSMPCSLRIGSCLMALYSGRQNSKIWNVLSAVHKNPCKANIYCAGFLIDKLGQHAKSMIQGFVNDMVGAKPVLFEPALYALNVCFRRAPQECVKLAEKAFLSGKKAVAEKSDFMQLRGLNLLRTLVDACPGMTQKVLLCIKALAATEVSVLVLDEISHLFAKIAVMGLDDTVEVKGEFQVGRRKDDSEALQRALGLLPEIPKVFKQALRRVLAMLSLSYIHKHWKVLFQWIRSNSFDHLHVLFAYLSADDLNSIYEHVITQDISQEQLQLLEMLTRDEDAVRATASLALQLLTTQPSKARGTECSFFRKLAKSHVALARNYLKASVMFLHNPPDTQNANREIRGMAMVATEILSVDWELAEPLKDKIVDYIPRALKSKFWEAHYHAAFLLMATLPEEYWPKDVVAKQLDEFARYCEVGLIVTDAIKGKLQMTALAITLFITNHPDVQGAARVMVAIHENEVLESFATKLCIVLAFPHLPMDAQQRTSLSQRVRSLANSATPAPEYMRAQLERPMLTPASLIRPMSPSASTEVPKIFFYVHASLFAEKCAEMFPDFILSLPGDMGSKFITTFVTSQMNYPIAPLVLLNLLRNDKARTMMPSNLYVYILEHLAVSDNSPRVQLFSECLGLCVKRHPEILSDVGKQIERMENPKHKCLAYAGLFCKCQPNDNFLIYAMHELNGMAFNAESSAYALYALDTLYETNMIQLSMLPLVNDQPTFFVSFLNSPHVMRPFVLFYTAKAFNSLLAIVSPELENDRKFVAPDIKSLIRGFNHMKIPYAPQIYNYVLRAVLALARQMAPSEKITYPMSRGASYQAKLSSCGVLCDYLKGTDEKVDYFSIVHDVIQTLQLTSDRRASDFISEIAVHFVQQAAGEESSEPVRKRIKEWTDLIKSCITCQDTGETQIVIDSSAMVKKCCLAVSSTLLAAIRKSEPLMTESLDDIVTSAVRCIDNSANDLVEETYNTLSCLLTTFGDMTDEHGHKVLDLYESQFSAAIRAGFDNLSLCGTFMLKFLALHLDEIRSSPDDFLHLLDIFINGLSKTKEYNSTYLAITAQILVAARISKTVLEHVAPFQSLFCEKLGATVAKAKDLWTNQPPNWTEIAKFRTDYSSVYSEIVAGFVWLQSLTGSNIIPPQELLVFFINEISNCTEGWRITAATHGVVSLIQYYASEIPDDKLDAMLRTIGQGDKMTTSSLPLFIDVCAKRLASRPDSWKLIMALIERILSCSSQSLAYMLYYGDPDIVLQYADTLLKLASQQSGETGLAIATLVFERIPAKRNLFIERVVAVPTSSVSYKLGIAMKYLGYQKEIPMDSPALRFAFDNLFGGGVDILVDIITTDKLCMVDVPEFRELFAAEYDPGQTITMLQLALIAINKYGTIVTESYDMYISQVLDFVFQAARQYGITLEFGKEIWKYAAAILNFCQKEYEKFVRLAFKKIPAQYQTEFLETVERIYNRSQPQKRGMSLKMFSTNTSAFRKDGDIDQKEWNTVIVSD